MCVDIMWGMDNISSIGELRARFNVLPTDLDETFEDGFTWTDDHTGETYIADDFCLCGVDIPAVLDRAGLGWAPDDFGYRIITDADGVLVPYEAPYEEPTPEEREDRIPRGEIWLHQLPLFPDPASDLPT